MNPNVSIVLPNILSVEISTYFHPKHFIFGRPDAYGKYSVSLFTQSDMYLPSTNVWLFSASVSPNCIYIYIYSYIYIYMYVFEYTKESSYSHHI